MMRGMVRRGWYCASLAIGGAIAAAVPLGAASDPLRPDLSEGQRQ